MHKIAPVVWKAHITPQVTIIHGKMAYVNKIIQKAFNVLKLINVGCN